MKTAVVILNWNGRKLLEAFLPSVDLHSKSEAEIYVVDNASTDDSITFIEENYAHVKIIRNSENGGYARGYNEGLKKVDADLYVLLNSDVEVTANWLTPVIEQFEKQPELASAQPKILDYKNKNYFEYAGAAGGFIDKYGFPYCRGRIFNTLEQDKKQYDGNTEIFWASGACFFVRKQAFLEAGGFDEDYFAHQEEIDLCWRFCNLNYKTLFISSSKVYHLGGATLKSNNPNKTFLNFRNSLYTLLKNVPRSKLLSVIVIRMILDGFAGIHYLVSFKPYHFFAILKAHFHFYTSLSFFFRKRSKSIKKEQYFNHKSIVFSYFVRQRKKFNSL